MSTPRVDHKGVQMFKGLIPGVLYCVAFFKAFQPLFGCTFEC